jgi:recombination protein RecA
MAKKKQLDLSDIYQKEGQEKDKALQKALTDIEKAFGAGAIMRMGDKPRMHVDTISTGILSLDMALGIGGLPRGRMVEIYGPESSGKTTVALQTVAALQKAGGTAAYIDAENAMDPVYAQHLGVDIDQLLLSQPGSGEEGLEIADALVNSGAVDLVVVDSVAALVPRAEITGEMGDAHVGLQARLMSQALRKLAGNVNKTNTLVIFINQLREKVGVSFGSPEVTPGGRALKFYASIRLDIRRTGQYKDGTELIGNTVKIKVSKNKLAPPFKETETNMIFGQGIEHYGDLLALATVKDHEVINKSGAWYSYDNVRIGQGAPNATKYLKEHPEMAQKVEDQIRQNAMPKEEKNSKDEAADKAGASAKVVKKAQDTSKETQKQPDAEPVKELNVTA